MKRIFISYSRVDSEWKERLQVHLKLLEKMGELDVWEDSRIVVGDNWLSAIKEAIINADVAILLISPDFLSSEFIQEEEIQKLLKRREEEKVRICPLLIRPCGWACVDWLKGIKMWPRDWKALSGRNNDYEVEECLVDFVNAVRSALSEQQKNAESIEGENRELSDTGTTSTNPTSLQAPDKSSKIEVEPDKTDLSLVRNRLLLMTFFGLLGGITFAGGVGGLLKLGLGDQFPMDIRHIVLFNSVIWAFVGAFCAKNSDCQVLVISGSFLGFIVWFLFDLILNGKESGFVVRGILFGPGTGAIFGIIISWIVKKKVWRPVVFWLTLVLLSALIYFTLIVPPVEVKNISGWSGDWIHRETWSDMTVSEGTMTLNLENSGSNGSPSINGSAYNMLHQKISIKGTSMNSGTTLVGTWKNEETGKKGTFEWQYIPPSTFSGHFIFQGEGKEFTWKGVKYTSGYNYIITGETVPNIGYLNMRTIFLSGNTLSKMKKDVEFQREVDKSTIIKALKAGDELSIIETLESQENDIGKWYKILTRIDGVIRKGYISALYNNLSTITLKKIPIGSNIAITNLDAKPKDDFRNENLIKIGDNQWGAHGWGEKKVFKLAEVMMLMQKITNPEALSIDNSKVFISKIQIIQK